MSAQFQHKKDIIETGRRLYLKGFVASHDGNISIRIDAREILTTASGVCKGLLSAEDVVLVDTQGKKIAGRGEPSSELKMHLLVYEKRPDVRAVVHAHPPVSTGFAVAGIPLAQCILPEVVVSLGAVPVAAYGTPSTYEVCEAIRPYVEKSEAFLLANHGVVTLGEDVLQAYYRMETVEHFAKILLTARLLGNVNVLSREQVEKLMEVRKQAGVRGKFPDCESCGYCSGSPGSIAGATTGAAPRAAVRPAVPTGTNSSPEDRELITLITAVIKEMTQGK
ncbi:MAG: class II aldolase/adducin family protein [Candidatus Eisenbacteria bacterium]|nr:class II aldolase/adducin family protein [Candidatus Eisenbacteria bacterium]